MDDTHVDIFLLRCSVRLTLVSLLLFNGCVALKERNSFEDLLKKIDSAPSPTNLVNLTSSEKCHLLDVLHEVSQLDTDQLRRFISEYQRRRCTLPDDLNFENFKGGPWGLIESSCKLYVLILYATNITCKTKSDRGLLTIGPGWMGYFDKDDDRIPAGAECPIWPLVILPTGKIELGGSFLTYTGPPSLNYEYIFEQVLEKYGRRVLPCDGIR